MPPNRFEVDLTSVCVRSGALQLPYRLQGTFEEGPVAAVDADGGASLELRFRPPRELVGLQAFFEAHGLRANDRIGLVFTEQGLRIEAVRRERKAPARGAARSGPSAPGARAGEPPADREHGTRRSASPAAPPDGSSGQPSRSAASSAPPSLRMAAPAPSEPLQQREKEAPRAAAAPRWQPLDVTAPHPDPDAEGETGAAAGGEASGSTTRVREIRRGALLSPTRPAEGGAASDERAAAPAPAGASGDEGASDEGASKERRQERSREDRGEPRGWDLFGLRRRFGLDRSDAAAPEPSGSSGGGSARPPRQERNAASEAGGPPRGSEPEPSSGWLEPVPTLDRGAAPGVEPDASGAAAAVHAGVAAAARRDEGAANAPSEEARAAVQAYLARPDVPAIVRAERVAEALGLSVEHADAALDRISEASEHLSRIRAGAYMLRRRNDG